MENLKLGQTLYTRGHKGIEEYKVISIGRKYYHLKQDLNYYVYKVNKDSLTYIDEEYSQRNKKFYTSLEQIQREDEYEDIVGKIRKEFGIYNKIKFSFEQLLKVKEILNL